MRLKSFKQNIICESVAFFILILIYTFILIGKHKNFLLLHLIVFIWGFTAIIGKLITLPAVALVWYRLLIAIVTIALYLLFIKLPIKLSTKSLLSFFGVGLIIALHWLFFYEAIKVSNVSVTLSCFASGTLFAALLEPIFFKRKIIWFELLFGLIVMAGIYLIFRFETKYVLGMIYSLAAAFTGALFTVLNGILIKKHDARVITFYEFTGGFLMLTAYFLLTGNFSFAFFTVSAPDVFWLMVLAVLCTAFTFIMSVEIMKSISPFTVVLTVNLEPVYGIILAYFIFADEQTMSTAFYIGTGLILATIFTNAALKKYIG